MGAPSLEKYLFSFSLHSGQPRQQKREGGNYEERIQRQTNSFLSTTRQILFAVAIKTEINMFVYILIFTYNISLQLLQLHTQRNHFLHTCIGNLLEWFLILQAQTIPMLIACLERTRGLDRYKCHTHLEGKISRGKSAIVFPHRNSKCWQKRNDRN